MAPAPHSFAANTSKAAGFRIARRGGRLSRPALAVGLALALSVPWAGGAPLPARAASRSPVAQQTTARFLSLAASRVYMRTGPGKRYPVAWVYHRDGLPVKVIAEHGDWRQVTDVEGTVGWIDKLMLSSRRSLVITGAVRPLRKSPTSEAGIVLNAEPGVQGRLIACWRHWCQAEIAGQRGWLSRAGFWGVYRNEIFN